eukprot:2982291-Pleurochrysis_carterae.AAC.1
MVLQAAELGAPIEIHTHAGTCVEQGWSCARCHAPCLSLSALTGAFIRPRGSTAVRVGARAVSFAGSVRACASVCERVCGCVNIGERGRERAGRLLRLFARLVQPRRVLKRQPARLVIKTAQGTKYG